MSAFTFRNQHQTAAGALAANAAEGHTRILGEYAFGRILEGRRGCVQDKESGIPLQKGRDILEQIGHTEARLKQQHWVSRAGSLGIGKAEHLDIVHLRDPEAESRDRAFAEGFSCSVLQNMPHDPGMSVTFPCVLPPCLLHGADMSVISDPSSNSK